MKYDVAILIVTYNSAEQIVECLDSVFAECATLKQQVVVVDNNSQDNTAEIIEAKYPKVSLIRSKQNLGFSKGVNLAAKNSDAEFVLLLNPDTVVLNHAIDEVVQFARSNPSYGVYGGRTIQKDGRLEPSCCWGLPSLWSLTAFAIGLSSIAPRNRYLAPESLGNWQRDSVRVVGMITGCFMLVRHDAWIKLQGLDERYFMYGEDADFAMRAHRAGFHPVVVPQAQIVHEVGKSSATPLHKSLLLYRGKAAYVRTHWKGLHQRFGLMMLVLGVLLRASMTSIFKSKNPAWMGLWKQRQEWLVGYPG